MSLKVGITGGIGVGKSFCANIFSKLGIPIYDADSRAKWIMVNDQKVREGIINTFGQDSYHDDGTLNRKHLSDIIFKQKDMVAKINQIVHPAVGLDTVQWFSQLKTHYGLYEAALMYESGSVDMLDKVIVVDAPLELRISRTIARDHISKEDVLARINKQMNQKEKVDKADYVINNDGLSSLLAQIWRIHQELLSMQP